MAALSLAVERDPHHVSIAEIASAANVSPRTVMNYFSSKDEVIVGLGPDLRAAVVDMFEARPSDEPPLEALKATFIEAIVRDVATGELWRAKSRIAREHPRLKRVFIASLVPLEDALSAAIARRTGLDRERHQYPQLVAGVSLAALRAVLDRTARGPRAAVEVALAAAFSSLNAGLPMPSTSERADRPSRDQAGHHDPVP